MKGSPWTAGSENAAIVRTLLISRAAAATNDSVVLERQKVLVVAGQVVQRGREDGHGRGVDAGYAGTGA